MTKIWKQERPYWCKYQNCIFRKRHQDAICGGILPKPEPHNGDFNTHRVCIRFSDSDIVDIQINKSDLDYLRSIFDSLDGKKTSWLSGMEKENLRQAKAR